MENELKVIDKRIPEISETKGQDTTDIVLVAMQNKYDPALIEKMMELSERNEKNVARKAFYEALANFKAEAPQVKKDQYNKFFDSWYTSLGNLLDTYNPYLGQNGLSISFPTPQQTKSSMTVECRLSHRLGHSESITMTGPIDIAAVGKESGKRSRNPLQDLKSTFTYLRSATCEAILGVAGTEATEDDDGNSVGVAYISNEQAKTIDNLLRESGADGAKFMDWLDVEKINNIKESQYQEAVKFLNSKITHKKNREKETNDSDSMRPIK